MVVLILDVECLGLDFALRCAAAGHQVFWFRHSPKKPVRDGEGFEGITIISEWQSYMPKARDGLIVVTGNCALLSSIDRYRQDFGYKVFGPTVASAKLEIERGAGMKVMEAAGLELPPYKMFDSLEDAEKFARKSDRAWVHKPMGDTPDKDLTFVSKDPGDLCGWLRRQIKSGKQLKGQCMLQEKLDMLCEYGVSGWFGSDGFLPGGWGTSWEHKKLFPGEIGPNTGEMGTLGQYMEEEKLATECLEPLAAAFAATGHTGDASIGVGIDNKGKAWPFELTMRLGYPAWYLQMASHKGDPAKWMRSLLDGKDDLRVSDDVCIAVVCAHPRWPYDSSTPAMVEGDAGGARPRVAPRSARLSLAVLLTDSA